MSYRSANLMQLLRVCMHMPHPSLAARSTSSPCRRWAAQAAQGASKSISTHASLPKFDTIGDGDVNRLITKHKLLKAAGSILWREKRKQRGKEPSDEQLHALERRLGHTFSEISLLKLALVHSSAATINGGVLSWIGDASLYLIASEQIAAAMGESSTPGEMSIMRKNVVSRENCSRCAEALHLGELIVVGGSLMKQDEPVSSAMVAEAFEAVLGAVYVDGGLEAARRVYCSNFPLENIMASAAAAAEKSARAPLKEAL